MYKINNKLIGEFMVPNWELLKKDNYDGEIKNNLWTAVCLCSEHYLELGYHKSWNKLMTVILKICEEKHWSINATLEWLSESQERDGLYIIEDVYKAVIEYITKNKTK